MKRLRFGEWLAGLSALALFGFLFLGLFGAHAATSERLTTGANTVGFYNRLDIGGSGWNTLGWAALAFCILAIAAGLVLPVVFAAYESPVLPVIAGIVATLLGGLAVIA